MHTADVVTHGTTQMIRLPERLRLPDGALEVLRLGDSLLLTPAPRAETPPPPAPPPGPSPSSPPPAAAAVMAAPRARTPLEDDLEDALWRARRRLRAEQAWRAAPAEREVLAARAAS